VFRRVIGGHDQGFMSVHPIATMYPLIDSHRWNRAFIPQRLDASFAENLLPHFETVPALKKDYLEAAAAVERAGWGGAKIYGALILNCASTCDADRIYTFSLSDFQMLAPATIGERICAP